MIPYSKWISAIIQIPQTRPQCSSSQTPGASAFLSFSGEAVALYGTVLPNYANFRVVIDGQSLILPGGSGGNVSAVRPQVSKQSYVLISGVFIV